MRMTLDELINAMEPQARKDKALISKCVDGLTEYAAELRQKAGDAGKEQISALRRLVDELAGYEQAVSLIGKAWRLTAEETSEQLALIEQEKAVMGRIENGESAEHIRQELLLNWSGLESIEVLEGLFETSTLLETAPERRSLFDMAMLLIETQNLLDWIEKTDAEKEKLIQNFT